MCEATVLTRPDDRRLESLLSELESEIARNAHRVERRALWQAARHYHRSRSWLEDLLPPAILSQALQDATTPSVTWLVLRHLCRHIRFNAKSQLGSPLRLRRCRTMAAGEVYLLTRQRAASRDRKFVGDVLSQICRAM
jgi:hypothetical protein